MGDRVKKERLDLEWIELMKVAKQQGFTKNEIRTYIKSMNMNSISQKT
jgi:hypothetical protein